jgi:hypothetical protein
MAVENFVEILLKMVLKNFLWGKVGKYEFFFVTLQSLSVISHTECRQTALKCSIPQLFPRAQKAPQNAYAFSGTPLKALGSLTEKKDI